ncbi:hypothetical protein AMELA_G00172860 [Ameiurus melas]|uniref:Uncharacterized protein n=1 Tax=Ameiurus melas TaxID=219545 RepID=A0A7J6AEU3_AMEME|nr:hypothetical protein AMELA_G00172860 [Ameiurus melas]
MRWKSDPPPPAFTFRAPTLDYSFRPALWDDALKAGCSQAPSGHPPPPHPPHHPPRRPPPPHLLFLQ